MKNLGLSKPNKRPYKKGAARYLSYPEKTAYKGSIGNKVIESDYIQRYLKGRSALVHFAGFSAKKTPHLQYLELKEALTVDTLINSSERFEVLDELNVDNAATFIGSISGKRSLSKTIPYLLEIQICPVSSVSKRPVSQKYIEENNSVFAKYFWNGRTFESVENADCQLQCLNDSPLRDTDYHRPKYFKEQKDIILGVYFLHQVRERINRPGHGFIYFLNEEVLFPSQYINFFVFSELNIVTDTLTVSIEQNTYLKKQKNIFLN